MNGSKKACYSADIPAIEKVITDPLTQDEKGNLAI